MAKKLAFSILGLLLFITPVVASAQTIEQLQAQIQSLLAQLAALQQGDTVSIPTNNQCPAIDTTLSRGMRGPEVWALQGFLSNQGLLDQENVSGYFGTLTEAAVRTFQSNYGIEATGVVGALTRAKIA